jgi:hypothetical protein
MIRSIRSLLHFHFPFHFHFHQMIHAGIHTLNAAVCDCAEKKQNALSRYGVPLITPPSSCSYSPPQFPNSDNIPLQLKPPPQAARNRLLQERSLPSPSPTASVVGSGKREEEERKKEREKKRQASALETLDLRDLRLQGFWMCVLLVCHGMSFLLALVLDLMESEREGEGWRWIDKQ